MSTSRRRPGAPASSAAPLARCRCRESTPNCGRNAAPGAAAYSVVPVPPAREVEIALPGGFRIGPNVLHAVRALPGVLEVVDV